MKWDWMGSDGMGGHVTGRDGSGLDKMGRGAMRLDVTGMGLDWMGRGGDVGGVGRAG